MEATPKKSSEQIGDSGCSSPQEPVTSAPTQSTATSPVKNSLLKVQKIVETLKPESGLSGLKAKIIE